jgi:hypothetical protein
MRVAALLVIAVIGLASCNSPNAPSSAPAQLSPAITIGRGLTIPGGLYSLTGTITERTLQGNRPMSGVNVNAWVQTPTIGFAYMFAYGPRLTDAQGRYELTNLPPGSRVRLQVFSQGYVQQCAVPEVEANLDLVMDAQLVARANVSASPDSVPRSLPGFRTISGVVYDVTAQGRRPAPDAFVDYEPVFDSPAAITYTNAEGRFLLCGIPEAGASTIGASIGLGRVAYLTVPAGPATSIEIEIR